MEPLDAARIAGVYWKESATAGPLERSTLSMFGPLVVITSLALAGQGAWELLARRQSFGALLIVVGFLVGSVGMTAAPYVKEIERRRKGRG